MGGKKILLLLVAALLITPSFAWWDNSWLYRKPVVITETSGSSLSNYQVNVVLNTQDLIGSSKMKSDCSDLRFANNEDVELYYYIESGCNSASTSVWVKVNSLSAGADTTIYAYYGNNAASSTSSGTNTFDYFDDFDPDDNTWTAIAGTWTNTAGYSSNSKKGVTSGDRQSLSGGSLSLSDFVLHAKVKSSIDNSIANLIFRAATNGNNDNDRIWIRLDQRASGSAQGGFHLFEDVSGSETTRATYNFNPVVDQWYDIKVYVHGSSAEGYLDGTQRWTTSSLSRTSAGYIQLQIEYLDTHDAWFDNVMIRKYASSEPTNVIGSEEAGAVCGDASCNGAETYSTCPADCCESDCTSTTDTAYHSECNTYNSCSGFVSGCNNQVLSYTYCASASSYITCPSSTTACTSGNYCLTGTGCSACSTNCDGVCQSSACYTIDPDCDAAGAASVACCGNTLCEGSNSESCSSCSSDCGVCPLSCGDGICNTDENTCTCPADCGSCSGTAGTCKSYYCISGSCGARYDLDCCGNLVCEEGETFNSCSTDCNPNYIDVQIISPVEGGVVQRGERLTITARVVFDDNLAGTGATVTATGFFGTAALSSIGNGYYNTSVVVPAALNGGDYSVSVRASRGVVDIANVTVHVGEELNVLVSTNIDEVTLTQVLTITGSVKNGQDEQVNSDISLLVYDNSSNILLYHFFDNVNSFEYDFQTSTVNPSGKWFVVASAVDSYNNSGASNISINAVLPETGTYYDIILSSPSFDRFSRKTVINVVAAVSLLDESVVNATVSFKDPFGADVFLIEGATSGVYGKEYIIPENAPLGDWNLLVIASKDLQGIFNKKIILDPVNISIEVLGIEGSNYRLGDTINLIIRAYYPDNSPVNLPEIQVIVNNNTHTLNRASSGLYQLNYVVLDEGELLISALVSDGLSNEGFESHSINVSGTSLAYYFIKYPYFTYPIITILLGGFGFAAYTLFKKRVSVSAVDKKDMLLNQIKELQKEYYEKGSINKSVFDNSMAKLEIELDKNNKKISGGKK